jgi:hypothetical protein
VSGRRVNRLAVVPKEVVQPCCGRLVVEAAVGSSVVVGVEVEGQRGGSLG